MGEIIGSVSSDEERVIIMTELGLVEVARTGIAAIGRGPEKL